MELEYNGRKYEPGQDDLLVADVTSGWMTRKLFGQGLKKEFDHEGERGWCIFIYQPPDGRVKHIPEGHVVAKVTSQRLDTNWPPLPAPQRPEVQQGTKYNVPKPPKHLPKAKSFETLV